MKNIEKVLEEILKMPLAEQQLALAATISGLFEKYEVDLVVVGGATVQYYTKAEYVTGDLDAILYGDTKEMIEEVMSSIGFKRTTSYRHFEHPKFPFVIEFPPSPVMVGSRKIMKVDTLEFGGNSVQVLKVEDVIMDRIIAGVEWKDQPSLDQARLMWIKNKDTINLDYLTDFAKKEGYLKTLREVMKV
jgi:hypothetical protein